MPNESPARLHGYEVNVLRVIKDRQQPKVIGAAWNHATEVLMKRGLLALEVGELVVTPAGETTLESA